MKFMQDYAATRAFTLGQPMQPTPLSDDKTVLFLRAEPRQATASLWSFDIPSGTERCLLSAGQLEETLSAEERARRERLRLTVGGFTSFTVAGDVVLLPIGGRAILYAKDGTTTWLPECLDPQLSPNGKRVAYVRDYDLFVWESGAETQLTFGGSSDTMHGVAEFVAQEEMHRMHGFWWSPDSQELAYTRVEQSHVELFRIADPLHPEREPAAFRYPRAGRDNARVSLFVGGEEIAWDKEAFPYLARVVWQEHGPLTFLVQSRDQRRHQLRTRDKLLLEETDAAWLNIDMSTPRWLRDGFLWTTEEPGWSTLQLRDHDGNVKRVVLGPDAQLERVIKVSGDTVFFLRANQSLCSVPLSGGPYTCITGVHGERSIAFGQSRSVYVETLATPTEWRSSRVLGKTLPSVCERSPLVPRVEWQRVGDLDAAFLTPTHYDSTKRYPVVLSVYGGPHHKHVPNARDGLLREQWLAEAGFIVVVADGRGTPRRGRAFERAISGDFTLPLQDQVRALQGIATPQMDMSRVGAIGWSFGGYMAALAVFERPDVFHCAVAGAPVVDWRDYDTHYTERYLGTDVSKYEHSSLLSRAHKLQRPLLLVHGTADDNVYFMHTLKLADALFKAGRPFELLPLPGATHMVPPALMPMLWQRMRDYLATHLLGS